MPIIPSDVQDLVDNPGELLHVELKEWLDLKDDIVRAKLARHLAALSNHGGGYLIFGFKNDASPAEPHPGDVSRYDHDAIGGIIDRYLAPTFQCEVFTVIRQGTGNQYPVVRIPGHGSIPVCAKRNGPHDKKNNPQGVRQGEYYIRAPGPKSLAIESPEQWKALIHRCVINERESVLASISKILQATAGKVEGKTLLDEWHESMHSYYLKLLKLSPTGWPVVLENNHYQLSYRIVGGSEGPLIRGTTGYHSA